MLRTIPFALIGAVSVSFAPVPASLTRPSLQQTVQTDPELVEEINGYLEELALHSPD